MLVYPIAHLAQNIAKHANKVKNNALNALQIASEFLIILVFAYARMVILKIIIKMSFAYVRRNRELI